MLLGLVLRGLTTVLDRRKLRKDTESDDLTPNQAAQLEERRRTITKRIRALRLAQQACMPRLQDVLERADAQSTQTIQPLPETTTIWVPSQLDDVDREDIRDLAAKEELLREAACHDALEKIRSLQRAKSHLVSFKRRNIRGQTKTTRARGSLDSVDVKIELNAERYRDHREALLRLRGPGDWTKSLRELRSADLVPPAAFDVNDSADVIGSDGRAKTVKGMKEIAKQLGEGYKQTSWIWSMSGVLVDTDDAELEDVLRVEWAKARARKLRWQEEAELLKEEMRRVRRGLEWKSEWWRRQAAGWVGLSSAEAEGVNAYAHRQAAVFSTLKAHFTSLWDKPLEAITPASSAANVKACKAKSRRREHKLLPLCPSPRPLHPQVRPQMNLWWSKILQTQLHPP
ncbi:CxC2 domain-containing protein [Salix suchowensis]|nr:CxC2 domain-containing protein [Salix suchowensis]